MSNPDLHLCSNPAIHPYHFGRTASWGHWAIDFMEQQHDLTCNFGVLAGTVYFPVGNCGPCDLPRREAYKKMIADWMAGGALPVEAIPAKQQNGVFLRGDTP